MFYVCNFVHVFMFVCVSERNGKIARKDYACIKGWVKLS